MPDLDLIVHVTVKNVPDDAYRSAPDLRDLAANVRVHPPRVVILDHADHSREVFHSKDSTVIAYVVGPLLPHDDLTPPNTSAKNP